jgi:hypothetical protein
MPRLAALRATAALGAILAAAGAAQAQLAADTVWEAWQSYSSASGQTLAAGSLGRDGATLTASKVRIETVLDGMKVAIELDRLDFTEQPDGTVAVAMPDAYQMRLTGEADQRMVVAIRHPGLRLTVAEGVGGLAHSMAAPEVSVAVTEFSGPAETPEQFDMQMTALGVAGTYDIPTDPGGRGTTDFTVGALNALLDVRDARDEHVMFDYAATGLGFGFSGAGLDRLSRMEDGDLAAALSDGLAMAVTFAYDTLRYSFDIDADGNQATGRGSAMQGDTRFVLDAGELSFRSSSRNGALTLSGSDMPMPELTLQAAEIGYGFTLPTTGAPEPQGAGLLVRLVDLLLPEEVWAMADPAGQMPRGPATAVLDLLAQIVMPQDLFGMETMFGYMMGGPMEVAQPAALDIRALELRAAGAELTGDGSFTFDATDTQTFPGMPRPAGVLNLTLRGGTQLLDTLVAMGVVPADQAQGARMMLALFARPGATPDELVSKLELREDGSIFANDMRIQ